MSYVNAKAKEKAFEFFVFFLIHNMDFNQDEIEELRNSGWKEYRRYWHIAPEGWSPAK